MQNGGDYHHHSGSKVWWAVLTVFVTPLTG